MVTASLPKVLTTQTEREARKQRSHRPCVQGLPLRVGRMGSQDSWGTKEGFSGVTLSPGGLGRPPRWGEGTLGSGSWTQESAKGKEDTALWGRLGRHWEVGRRP